MSDEERREEEQAARARPRIVDKRVSARRTQQAPEDEAAGAPAEPIGPPSDPARYAEPSVPEPPRAAPPGASQTPPPPQPPPGPTAVGEERVAPEAGGGQERIWTPEEEAEAQRIAEEISARPSVEWVLNVAVTLANVAGTKLDLGQPADARLAIDALAAIVNGVGTSLGDAENPLRQTLAQLQLAYAQTVSPPPP